MYSRGMEHYTRLNKQDCAKARHFFEKALELEETSALIHSLLGYFHLLFLLKFDDIPYLLHECGTRFSAGDRSRRY